MHAIIRGYILVCHILSLLLRPTYTLSLVTKEESDLILAKREDVVKNRALLQAIADRTGVYIDLEVRITSCAPRGLRQVSSAVCFWPGGNGYAVPDVARACSCTWRWVAPTGCIPASLQVKDCIEQFLETRENAGQMHRYATEFGMPLPKGSQEQREMRRCERKAACSMRMAE